MYSSEKDRKILKAPSEINKQYRQVNTEVENWNYKYSYVNIFSSKIQPFCIYLKHFDLKYQSHSNQNSQNTEPCSGSGLYFKFQTTYVSINKIQQI